METQSKKKQVWSWVLTILLVGLAATAVYAAFVSNLVTINSNVVTTGEATIKLCDYQFGNVWTNQITTNLTLDNMIPGEERPLLGGRALYIGNDNGGLMSSLPGNNCKAYLDPMSHATTPIKLQPIVVVQGGSCPAPAVDQLKLRFELKGVDTGYRTVNQWINNVSGYDPVFLPGEAGTMFAFVQLDMAATAQKANCSFNLSFAGRQAVP